MAGEQVVRFKPGENVPAFASTAVVAGTLVMIAGAKTAQGDYQIKPCEAKIKPFGVVENDSAPTTQAATSVQRRVAVIRAPAVARCKVGATAIVAAEEVEVAAGGLVVPFGTAEKGIAIGRACHTGKKEEWCEVALY